MLQSHDIVQYTCKSASHAIALTQNQVVPLLSNEKFSMRHASSSLRVILPCMSPDIFHPVCTLFAPYHHISCHKTPFPFNLKNNIPAPYHHAYLLRSCHHHRSPDRYVRIINQHLNVHSHDTHLCIVGRYVNLSFIIHVYRGYKPLFLWQTKRKAYYYILLSLLSFWSCCT